jgi:hypothetical protein
MTTENETVLSFDEINRQYNGEWVMLRVVKTEGDRIIEGAVLAHDAERETVGALLSRAQEQQPRPCLAFFRARGA